jgi:DNA-3-methyladenine glycosylase I
MVIIGTTGSLAASGPAPAIRPSADNHDEVWGARTYDKSALFEALTLGVFEVELSWSIVFGKRDKFRKAFRGFEVTTSV